MIRVMIVDDHTVFRQGLRAVLHGREGIEIVADHPTAERALADLPDVLPDVVLMDLGLPGRSGVDATRAIAAGHPAVRVLVLSMRDDRDGVMAALQAGAVGFLVKSADLDDVVRGVHAAARGQLIVDPSVAEHLTMPRPDRLAGFTPREREVLALLAEGLGTAAMAERLGSSVKTVRNHLSSVYLKLGVEDRGQATLAAARLLPRP